MHIVHGSGPADHADQHVHVSSWPHGLHDQKVQERLDSHHTLFGALLGRSNLVLGKEV